MKAVCLLLFISLNIACKKDKLEDPVAESPIASDYRDKFVGTYNCIKCNYDFTGDTSYYGPFLVEVTKDGLDSPYINIIDGNIPIDTAGHYCYCPPYFSKYQVDFIGDCISIYSIIPGSGSNLGNASYITYNGHKQ